MHLTPLYCKAFGNSVRLTNNRIALSFWLNSNVVRKGGIKVNNVGLDSILTHNFWLSRIQAKPLLCDHLKSMTKDNAPLSKMGQLDLSDSSKSTNIDFPPNDVQVTDSNAQQNAQQKYLLVRYNLWCMSYNLIYELPKN